MYDDYTATAVDEGVIAAVNASVPARATTRIALVGGFTPRRCGIATFTADIRASLIATNANIAVDVYAMTPALNQTQFDAAVCATISESDPASYAAAAAEINHSEADLVWLQHEFGLFGGLAGDMVIALIERISAPLIVTLHTVLPDPDPDQRRVIAALLGRASKFIVMSAWAQELLTNVYGADRDQIVLIPHGVPDRPFGRAALFKAKFGFEEKRLLLTFGLLSPGKGIETAIAALPAIIAEHPDTLYCIAGATHPNLLAREGEGYREKLMAQAASLGVEQNIYWIDAFLETEQLLDLIEAADIYITPYPGANQSTSGTLAYAVALGKAVVSTPFAHGRELLADGHGVLVPFKDGAAIAHAVNTLLADPARLMALQQRAYARGRDMIWPTFAAECLKVVDTTKIARPVQSSLTTIGINGLLRICDDTGILQHSIFSVPDRAHGYCVDDNARALMLANRLGADAEPHRSRLATTFAAFVQSAWNEETGKFRNFMDHRRNWLESIGSEDSCGRTIWALGATAREGQTDGIRKWARKLFERTAELALHFGSPRAIAFAMLGADYLLAADPTHERATQILTEGAQRLLTLFTQVRRREWHWFETVLAYDNSRLCEAMIRAGARLGRHDVAACGFESLDWLMRQQMAPGGDFRPVGSNSFGNDFEDARPFDQQPVEAWAAIDAAIAAYQFSTDNRWLTHAQRAYAWFGGANDRGVTLGNPITGSCYDGINPRGLNLNEGAESVLAYQLATCAMLSLNAERGG